MTTIALPERCDRAAAETLLCDLRACEGTRRLTIEADGVRQVGQAMLQVLLSVRRSLPQTIIVPSATLREMAALSGLSHHLFDKTPS